MKANSKQNGKPATSPAIVGYIIALAVIIVIGAGGYAVYRHVSGREASGVGQPSEQRRVPVVVTRPQLRDFERTLVVQGNVEAKNFAMVSPRIGGTIEAVFVDEGDTVVAKETKLFRTDAVKLKENVEIGRHSLTVARCAKREAVANLEKIRADLRKAKLDYDRFTRLYEQKQAVTADAFEQQQSRYQQMVAAEKLAAAQVDLTDAQEDQAKATLGIANKDLADATIYAPVSGKVSRRLLEPGEMGDPGQPVLRIDDTSVVEVAAFLPAQYYGSVIPGQTQMKIQVGGIDLGRHSITFKGPTINNKLRTFEAKCILTDPPEGVTPGAMAQISVILEGRKNLGVPSVAIQQRAGHNVVFVVRDNISHQVTVKPGIEMGAWTEIREGEVNEETAVVTMGQYMIEEGTHVAVQKEQK
jgi:RND family efflux transporter MFP subunit